MDSEITCWADAGEWTAQGLPLSSPERRLRAISNALTERCTLLKITPDPVLLEPDPQLSLREVLDSYRSTLRQLTPRFLYYNKGYLKNLIFSNLEGSLNAYEFGRISVGSGFSYLHTGEHGSDSIQISGDHLQVDSSAESAAIQRHSPVALTFGAWTPEELDGETGVFTGWSNLSSVQETLLRFYNALNLLHTPVLRITFDYDPVESFQNSRKFASQMVTYDAVLYSTDSGTSVYFDSLLNSDSLWNLCSWMDQPDDSAPQASAWRLRTELLDPETLAYREHLERCAFTASARNYSSDSIAPIPVQVEYSGHLGNHSMTSDYLNEHGAAGEWYSFLDATIPAASPLPYDCGHSDFIPPEPGGWQMDSFRSRIHYAGRLWNHYGLKFV